MDSTDSACDTALDVAHVAHDNFDHTYNSYTHDQGATLGDVVETGWHSLTTAGNAADICGW